jgi:beta-lactamase regulating signal transducer with metallopeptidase domain
VAATPEQTWNGASEERERRQPTGPTADTSRGVGLGVPLTMLHAVAANLAQDRTKRSAIYGWPEVVVVVYAVGAGIGLIRFALGLLSVQRLRRRSRRLTSPAVKDLLAKLHSVLGQRCRVEVRETADLFTAATVGWLRPLVLLPADWPTWTERQLRAVLAHEIAHIQRLDYAAGLLARVSVAMHFYHPLVRWLAGRLQLQQELAADALAAAAAGGRGIYLQALAQLALRQEERPRLGPARAFLPARGTLLRRIHMLRGEERSPCPAARRGRILWLCLLGIAALAVSAVRGPAQNAGDQAEATVENKALRQAAPAVTPKRPPFVFAEYRSDSMGIFALRPAELLRHPDMKKAVENASKELKDQLKQFGLDKALPPLDKIEQVTGCVYVTQNPKAPKGARHALMATLPLVRTTPDYDWNSLIDAIKRSDTFLKFVCKKAEEVHYEGKTYYRLTMAPMLGGGPDVCVGLVDRQTLVFAPEDAVKKLFRQGLSAAPAWAHRAGWGLVADSSIALVLDNRKGKWKGMLDPDETPPKDALTLLDRTNFACFGANWNGVLTLDVYARGLQEQDAAAVARAAKRLLSLGLREVDKELQKPDENNDPELRRARQLLDHAKVTRSSAGTGQRSAMVHVQSNVAISVAEIVEMMKAPATEQGKKQ